MKEEVLIQFIGKEEDVPEWSKYEMVSPDEDGYYCFASRAIAFKWLDKQVKLEPELLDFYADEVEDLGVEDNREYEGDIYEFFDSMEFVR